MTLCSFPSYKMNHHTCKAQIDSSIEKLCVARAFASVNCSTRREEGYRMWACKAVDPHSICMLLNGNHGRGCDNTL